MKFTNINQSWEAPEGFHFRSVEAIGAYLIVKFFIRADTDGWHNERELTVYANDMGRQVMTTEDHRRWSEAIPPTLRPPAGRWFRFKAALDLILLGISEVWKCRNKS